MGVIRGDGAGTEVPEIVTSCPKCGANSARVGVDRSEAVLGPENGAGEVQNLAVLGVGLELREVRYDCHHARVPALRA